MFHVTACAPTPTFMLLNYGWFYRLFQNTLATKYGHRIVYLASVTLVSRDTEHNRAS